MISMEVHRDVPQYMAIPWLMTWVIALTVSAKRAQRFNKPQAKDRNGPSDSDNVGYRSSGFCLEWLLKSFGHLDTIKHTHLEHQWWCYISVAYFVQQSLWWLSQLVMVLRFWYQWIQNIVLKSLNDLGSEWKWKETHYAPLPQTEIHHIAKNIRRIIRCSNNFHGHWCLESST